MVEVATAVNVDDALEPLIIHSVLNSSRLAQEIAARYDLPDGVAVQLLFRGMNDVYMVHHDGGRQALRAWRGGWRSLDEVRGELAFLDYLRTRDFAVAWPLRTREDELYFTLDAPEGARPLALYSWAPGKKVADVRTPEVARSVGAALARMHLIGQDYRSPVEIDLRHWDLEGDLPTLPTLLCDRPDDRRDMPAMAETVRRAFTALERMDLPQGPIHGDFHPANVHVGEDGALTFLDFDGCGHGYWNQDISNYVFGSDFYGFTADLTDAFLEGYDSIRPRTADEIALLDLFLLAKTFRLLTGIARNLEAVGRASLRYRDLAWFSANIRAGVERIDARLLA